MRSGRGKRILDKAEANDEECFRPQRVYNDWGGEVPEGEEVVAGLRLEARMLEVVCVVRVGGRGAYMGATMVENEANNEEYLQSIKHTIVEARKATTTSAWVVGTGPKLLAGSLGTP